MTSSHRAAPAGGFLRALARWVPAALPAAVCLVAVASWSDAPEVEALACDADVIVWGRVARVDVEGAGGYGHRVSRIEPTAVLKGDVAGEILEQSPEALHGAHPAYARGEEVVAFLGTIANSDRYVTLGRRQGKLLVEDGVVTRVRLPVEEFLEQLSRALGDCPGPKHP